jgi:ammonium transporter Rh
MTFMRKYKLGAVGLTFLITAICIPWATLCGRFFASAKGFDVWYKRDYPLWAADVGENETLPAADRWPKIELDINAVTQGNFAAAAVLISFGALIGKLTPAQTALLAILEVPLYAFNKEVLAVGLCGTLDMGGTIFIHLFGAYFGLAAAWVIGRPREEDAEGADPSHVSDVLSLVGTVFLWLYWPSFNGATAPLGQNQQLLTTANTVLALCGSCITSFVVSALVNKRISTVDIQNATLAGGVAIGASSNLAITPFFAMLVGVIAATVSTLGFNKLQPIVEERLKIHDSCGVHNLHGMPAVIGSLAVAIATTIPATHAFAGAQPFPRGDAQWAGQLEGALLTLVTAVLGGLAVGWIVKKALPNGHTQFTDAPFWTVADNFKKMD